MFNGFYNCVTLYGNPLLPNVALVVWPLKIAFHIHLRIIRRQMVTTTHKLMQTETAFNFWAAFHS